MLWEEPWLRLLLEEADAPYYDTGGEEEAPPPVLDDDLTALRDLLDGEQ